MKTLVVLSALTSLAFAAPSFSEKDYRRTDVWPEYRRDKKSTQGYFYAESAPVHFAGQPIHVNSEIDNSATSSSSARSFGFKKPVGSTIIKHNNDRYHLYRNSEEERAQADPLEDCSKQVKVKLCDRHIKDSKAFTRSVKVESNDQEEENMETKIKLAMEAIEDIQRELKNKEQSSKSAGWKQRENESDAEIHEDIEVARKVLDHIHRNFGKLESMSLRTEPSHQVHDETVESNDMKKMAQWDEHTETSKKNADEGRDMKDILQTEDHQLNSEALHTTQVMRNNEKEEMKLHEVPTKETTEVLKESTEVNNEKHANDDMSVAATSLEDKIVEPQQKHDEIKNLKARNNGPTPIQIDQHHENNDKQVLKSIDSTAESTLNNVGSSIMKVAAESVELPAGTTEKKADHMEEKLAADSETSVKSAEPEKDLKNTHEEQVSSSHNQQSKSVDNMDSPHMRAPVINKAQAKADEEHLRTHFLKGLHMPNMHVGHPTVAPIHHMHSHGHNPYNHHLMIHEKPLHHFKSADMDGLQSDPHMTLGDFSEKTAMEWINEQDSGRSAYGSYGAGGYGSGSHGGGSGAVGVFPSAHVGGCAVPLLLSCSPSVVTGTLAKSGYGHASGYGPAAAAYKAAEEKTHNKRDVKKPNEISKEKTTHKTTKTKTILTQKKN